MKAILLAGGFATRLWPLSIDRAKPLLPLAGKPIISHIVDQLSPSMEIFVCTNTAFADAFAAWADAHPHPCLRVHIESAVAEGQKKGAAGAIAEVIHAYNIDDDVLIVGADNVFGCNLQDLIDQFDDQPLMAVHDIGDLELARKYGVVCARGDSVEHIEEKPDVPRSTLISTSCTLYPKHLLSRVLASARANPDVLSGPFIDLHNASQATPESGIECRVFVFEEYWNDVGSFHAYMDTHRAFSAGAVHEQYATDGNVFEGVNNIDPSCVIENCYIKNSVIMAGSVLRNCDIENSVIDEGCRIEGALLKDSSIKRKTVLL